MFVSTPVVVSEEENLAAKACSEWIKENSFPLPEETSSYKLTRKKHLSTDGELHRHLYVYNSTGKRILEQELPFDPNDPGIHSYKAFKKNNEWEKVVHGAKGTRKKIGLSFFKPVLTTDGRHGLMKQTKYGLEHLENHPEIQRRFNQLSGVTSKIPAPSYHLGNVIEESKTVELKMTQYMNHAGDDLFDIMFGTDSIEPYSFSENMKQYIAINCLKRLAQLHAQNIVHGDIKPENICMTPESVISIIDFDTSYRLDVPTDHHVASGTYGYMPPEYFTNDEHPDDFESSRLSNKKYDEIRSQLKPNHGTHASKDSDVYSMGRVLEELRIENSHYDDLIKHMLQEDPRNRPDISGLAEMNNKHIHQCITLKQYDSRNRYHSPVPPKKEKQASFTSTTTATIFSVSKKLAPGFEANTNSEENLKSTMQQMLLG